MNQNRPHVLRSHSLFQFMYSFLVPNFKIQGRIEEEVPKIFKNLGYPFTISKSAMYAIGSPHTWPTLLSALSWLRQELEVNKHIQSWFPLIKISHSLEQTALAAVVVLILKQTTT